MKYQLAGGDVSIQECVNSGYGIVKWPKNTLIHKAETIQYFQVTRIENDNYFILKTNIDIQHLIDGMDDRGFKSFIDFENCPYPIVPEEFEPNQVATLAESLESYKGYLSNGYPVKTMAIGDLIKELYKDVVESETLSINNVIEQIGEILIEADGFFVAQIANKLFSKKVRYIGDGIFEHTI